LLKTNDIIGFDWSVFNERAVGPRWGANRSEDSMGLCDYFSNLLDLLF
jgi:hypothetical protein